MPTPPHRVLIAEARLHARIAELAGEIASDLPVRDPLVVGLLRGSFIFMADLCRALARHDVDAEIDMAWVTRYSSDEQQGDLRVIRDVESRVEGRAVLLIDDIVDSGLTLHHVHAKLAARSPAWLATCVLLDKRDARRVAFEPEYRGFDAPDEWVFGYGLDTNGFGRSLPHVAVRTR